MSSVMEWGRTASGDDVQTVTLDNGTLSVSIMTYGATVIGLKSPDKYGRRDDVVLGFDSMQGYESDSNAYFGATVGRVANRISNSSFYLDGHRYALTPNEPPHHLHGGPDRAFDRVVWTVVDVDETSIHLQHEFADGVEGYPGNLSVSAVYRLLDSTLAVEYRATSDARTPLNMTNHMYFNLRGAGASDILDHTLRLQADYYTPVDDALIPTGEVRAVDGTVFDFRTAKLVGQDLGALTKSGAGGFDHNFCVRSGGEKLREAATLGDAVSGRRLELLTNQIGVQLYTGNQIEEPIVGKNDTRYGRHAALCLEPQGFPNSVNTSHFPSSLIAPGETYEHLSHYRFSVIQ